jgi:hypothetical protein
VYAMDVCILQDVLANPCLCVDAAENSSGWRIFYIKNRNILVGILICGIEAYRAFIKFFYSVHIVVYTAYTKSLQATGGTFIVSKK